MYVFEDLNEVLILEPIRLMAENLLGKRDKPKFYHDGYLYVYDKCSKSDPKRRDSGRHLPLFPTRMWNQYRRTIAGEDRTNNHAETAHRKLYAELGSNHPLIWKFIEGFRTVQRGRDAYYEQLIAGKNRNQRLLKYIKADERILNIVKQFDSRAPLEYLRGLGHNYDMN